jgi:hypothetical protein
MSNFPQLLPESLDIGQVFGLVNGYAHCLVQALGFSEWGQRILENGRSFAFLRQLQQQAGLEIVEARFGNVR